MSEKSFLDYFTETICGFKGFFYHLLILQVAILVILLFSLAVIERSGAAWLVLKIDLFVLSALFVATIAILVYCKEY